MSDNASSCCLSEWKKYEKFNKTNSFYQCIVLSGILVNLALYVYFDTILHVTHLAYQYSILLLGEWACLALLFLTFVRIVITFFFERKHEKEDK